MSDRPKRVSHTLAALQKQIEAEKERESADPLAGLTDTFDFEFIKKITENKDIEKED